MYQVFISHKTQELPRLEALVDALRQVGIGVYIAERDPWPGLYLYDQKIVPAIRNSDCVLVLLTNDGAASPDVNQEIGMAHTLRKPIIALVEVGVRTAGVLSGREVIYFDRAQPMPALSTVYNHVTQLAASKQQAEQKSKEQTALIIGGLALLFLLGGGGGGKSG